MSKFNKVFSGFSNSIFDAFYDPVLEKNKRYKPTLPVIEYKQIDLNSNHLEFFDCGYDNPIVAYNGRLFYCQNCEYPHMTKYVDCNKCFIIAANQRQSMIYQKEKQRLENQKEDLNRQAEEKKKRDLQNAIQKSNELKNKPLPKCVDRAFDLSVVNLDCNYPIDKIIEGVHNFGQQLVRQTNKVKNLCMLFSGNSGTGKSEFAKYLAYMSGLKFSHIRASDLLDKYVGETEKSITKLFQQVSREKGVLLIDEADSLLQDRNLSSHSWQTTQVNELLCRMQEFQGILICSSNLINHFDKAAMRRFIFKIKFLGLTEEGKLKLARKYLDEVCLLPQNIDQIKQINDLRPGDFKAVRDRLLIVYRDKVSFEEALNELKLETSYRIDDNLKATL